MGKLCVECLALVTCGSSIELTLLRVEKSVATDIP